jgi:hypothetical protein
VHQGQLYRLLMGGLLLNQAVEMVLVLFIVMTLGYICEVLPLPSGAALSSVGCREPRSGASGQWLPSGWVVQLLGRLHRAWRLITMTCTLSGMVLLLH